MSCDICEASTQIVQNEIPLDARYSSFCFETCKGCGHIKILPPLSDSNDGQAYIRLHTAPPSRISSRVRERAKRVISHIRNQGVSSIYDIGSGNCGFAIAFSRFGCRGIAVDIERFNPSYPHFVNAEKLDEYLKSHGAAGFFSNHSFEHIELVELTALLESIKKHICDGAFGYFVMPAPKNKLIDSGIYLEEFVYGHKNLFTLTSASIYFGSIYKKSEGFIVSVGFEKSRMSFLKTRLRLALKLFSKGYLLRTIQLLGYLLGNVTLGSPEEIVIKIQKA